MIIFVPFSFVLVLLVMGLGLVYEILENISGIIYVFWSVCSFFIGLYVIYTGFKEKRDILCRITYVAQGIWVSVALIYIHWLYLIAEGYSGYDVIKYSFFDAYVDKYGEVLVSLVISVILVIVISILAEISRNFSSVMQILTIVVICAVFVGGYAIARKDEFQNSKDTFNFNNYKYETIQNAVAKRSILGSAVFWNSYIFKENTPLYASYETTTIDGENYILVSDGTKMGFVEEGSLQSFYEEVYVTTETTEIYATEVKEEVRSTRYGSLTAKVVVPTSNVVEMVSEGTQVTYERDLGHGYVLITLSDGTEGVIKEEYLELKEVMK